MVAQAEVRRDIPPWETVKAQLNLEEHLGILLLYYQTQVLIVQGKKQEAQEIFRKLDSEYNFDKFERDHRDVLDNITEKIRHSRF